MTTLTHVILVMCLAGLSMIGLVAAFIHVTVWACNTVKREIL